MVVDVVMVSHKITMSYNITVGVASQVSEILLLYLCLQKWPKFPFEPWTIALVHGCQKIESAQKIHASRGCGEMHANQNLCA